MLLLQLPVELTVEVLSNLTIPNLVALSLSSQAWHAFITENESMIYHNAARLYNFIQPSSNSQLFHEATRSLYSPRSLKGVASWKELCQRRIQINRSWLGKGPSSIVEHHASPGRRLHRIKVDEMAGFIITTSANGGLAVTDIDTDELLWSLPETYVRPYAHCEYDKGYIVFDRRGFEKEVWRLSRDFPDSNSTSLPPSSLPDARQRDVSPSGAQPDLFKPWALIQNPETTRAYRFVHPTLLVAAFERVYLWDIPSARLVQVIEDIQSLAGGITLGTLNYVELSKMHVFLCGSNALRVLSREGGEGLTLKSSKFVYGQWRYALAGVPWGRGEEGAVFVEHEVDATSEEPDTEERQYLDEFVAAHVSSCGSHLVGLLSSSRLIVMPNFERAICKEVNIFNLTLDIQLGSPRADSVYLAFEKNHVAVVTCSAVFVVYLDPTSLDQSQNKPPPLRVFRIPRFTDPIRLASVSCLQLSDTGLYLAWSPTQPDDEEGEDDFEEDFWASLADPPIVDGTGYIPRSDIQMLMRRLEVLHNGDYVVVTHHPNVGHEPSSSDVFSVNFV